MAIDKKAVAPAGVVGMPNLRAAGSCGAADGTSAQSWLKLATVQHYGRGQAIIEAGQPLQQWMAIREGATRLSSRPHGRGENGDDVPVAILWFGDVIGWTSPVGKELARYEVTALTAVSTLTIPKEGIGITGSAEQLCKADVFQLYAATATRIQDQVSLRLSGNGLQRLVGVLATLAMAAAGAAGQAAARRSGGLHLPMAQALIGSFAGLARRQTWVYLQQLAEAGWVSTGHSKLILEAAPAWLQLLAEVERSGLDCIATVDACNTTLSRLWHEHQAER